VGYGFHPGTDAFASSLQKEGLAPRYYAVLGLGFLVGRGLGAVLAVMPPSTCRRGWGTFSGQPVVEATGLPRRRCVSPPPLFPEFTWRSQPP
jgi:hypothetical protein